MKKVYQFTTNGRLVNTFKSVAEAARVIGVKSSSIIYVCRGKRNTCKGFVWSYKNDNEICLEKDDETIWMPIKGFGSRYEISIDDRVRSKGYTIKDRIIPPKELKVSIDCEGYKYCTLDRTKYRIHRIKYEAFVGEIPEGLIIDHINRDRQDNRLENIRLVDASTSVKNRTLKYRPDIIDYSKCIRYKNKESAHPFALRFSEDGVRRTIGYYKTYEEAENKYRELYNERQRRIDDACA